jgi:hypothetical protein
MQGTGTCTDSEASLIGQTLAGRWQVVRILGRGGMCTVYEARQDHGAPVALKLLSPVLAQNPRARARFLREGRVANAVGHPNAVRVLDSGVASDDHLFLVMELLEGETLRQRRMAAGGRLPAPEVLHVAERVLEVLGAAHSKAIFHRDIKPENIFLTTDRQVKVLDFGIAAVRDEAEDGEITQSGVSIGTPAFMAPEQARGRHSHVDARTDIWAVGATMFLCLAGRHVHGDASTANEALIFSATQRAPSLRRFCPTLSARVAGVIDRALELDPGDRWESADAMRFALARAIEPPAPAHVAADAREAEIATTEDGPLAAGVSGPGPSSRRRGLPAAGVVLVLCAAAGAATALRTSRAGPGPAGRAQTAVSASPHVEPAGGDDVPPTARPAPSDTPTLPSAGPPARRVRRAPSAEPAASYLIPNEVLDRRK